MTANIDGAGQAVTTDAIPISELKDGHEFILGSETKGSEIKFVVADTEMFGLCGKVEFFAKSEQFRTILLEGETGTGKELIARLIYDRRHQDKRHKFMIFNCANVYQVIDSDLFGHKRGSFTGAERDRNGILADADRGFVFLDEISQLSLKRQAKFLRFLENGTIRPIGTNEEKQIDVRLVVATNKNLETLVEQGKFLADLYYRVSEIRCRVPSLSQRPADIEPLVKCFLAKLLPAHQSFHITPDSLERLRAYSWPGNVRELHGVIKRATLRCLFEHSNLVQVLPGDMATGVEEVKTLKAAKDEAIRSAMKVAFKRSHSMIEAAQLLGICRTSLYEILEEYPDLKDFRPLRH
ncbi:MAG TPA: sigma 54-interacting transcriptional regulator [Candidatus Paceibacterota bacterium]|nr:sigma 54-interacting transcriptional regulator [Candidatus Paceibacterota bacterium]